MLALWIIAGLLAGAGSNLLAGRTIEKIRIREHETGQKPAILWILAIPIGMGLLAGFSFHLHGLSFMGIALPLFGLVLAHLSLVDWYTFEIPLYANLAILLLGLLRIGTDLSHWKTYLIGALAVGLPLFLLYQITGGGAIGGGDVKLMAAAGLFTGWQLALLAFFLGCILGAVIHLLRMRLQKVDKVLAMGPYLSLGLLMSLLWGQRWIDWYLRLL